MIEGSRKSMLLQHWRDITIQATLAVRAVLEPPVWSRVRVLVHCARVATPASSRVERIEFDSWSGRSCAACRRVQVWREYGSRSKPCGGGMTEDRLLSCIETAMRRAWRNVLSEFQKDSNYCAIFELTGSGIKDTVCTQIAMWVKMKISQQVRTQVMEPIQQMCTRTERHDAVLDCVFEQVVAEVRNDISSS